jgi:hypothetical protein
MQRSRNILGITLAIALSSTAALAAPGDAWYGTYEDEDKVQRPPLAAATPQQRNEELARYEERLAEPVVVEREYLAPEPRERILVAPASPPYDPRHPNTGALIERGLFNKTGPNDFGA